MNVMIKELPLKLIAPDKVVKLIMACGSGGIRIVGWLAFNRATLSFTNRVAPLKYLISPTMEV